MPRYQTAAAFRVALERRLRDESVATGIRLDRFRRQVMVECFLARVETADPGRWVLKGAVALEVRLGPGARATRDVDLGLRSDVTGDGFDALVDRLVGILAIETDDFFVFRVRDVRRLAIASFGDVARARIAVQLAGREFGGFQVDIAGRAHELYDTERLVMPGHLRFAGIDPPDIEVVVLDRHIAEKFAGMTKQFGDRENTRVRDLVDVVLLHEHGLVEPTKVAPAVQRVWAERGEEVPSRLPPFPPAWPDRYARMVGELEIDAVTFADAVLIVDRIWRDMFPAA